MTTIQVISSLRRPFLLALTLLALTGLLATPLVSAQEDDERNILQTLEQDSDLSTLEQVLRTARIEDSIAFTDEITLLAPTNAAFEALPETVRTRLLEPQNQDALLDILRYHVVLKDLDADDLDDSQNLITLAGTDQNISIATVEDVSSINDAVEIKSLDESPTNGSLVTISAVLLPEGFDVSALKSASTEGSTSSEALDSGSTVTAVASAASDVTPRTGGYTVSIAVLGVVVLASAGVFSLRQVA